MARYTMENGKLRRVSAYETYNSVQKRAYDMILKYEADSKMDIKRINKAKHLLNMDIYRSHTKYTSDNGLAGKVAEILSHDSESTITRVQKQGATDLYVIIDGKRTKCEYKTNGGRIESLYRIHKPESRYIVYELDFTPADRTLKDGTIVKGIRRYAKKLMKVSDFLAMLEATNSVKSTSHKGKNDVERAVQCNKKALYEALINGGYTDYDRNKTYLSDRI